MDVYAFRAKWRAAQGTERALAQAHVLDPCALAGLPDHALGDGVAFERAVAKVGGGTGFADAWVRGRFAMEYKGRAPTSTRPTPSCCSTRTPWRTRPS